MANGRYTAGTLDLSILGYSDSAVESITKTVRALNSLRNSISKMTGVNYGAQADKLGRFFEKLAKTTNAIDPAKLKILAAVGRSFSNISSISKLEKLDYAKVATGFQKLAIAIRPFVNEVKGAEASLTALYGILSKSSGKKIQGLLGANQKESAKSPLGMFGIARLGTTIYLARRLGRTVAEIVKDGSDYLETMNLWQVAMRENLDIADEFVNKMNKAYGVSAKTVMQAQATFKNMIGSLGDLSNETSYALSEAITQMALDYSSLYNVKLQSAVEKFQSALAGQVRPIRSISGYDITEKTIHALYQSLGGTKTQRQLSRTEKQLLAILAIFKQMEASGALGDMGKTLNMFANQTRMMTENFIELRSWTGMLVVDLLESWGIMVKFNAMLITITEVVKRIAQARGVGDETFYDGIFESAKDATEEVEKLESKLLEFDKFRSLGGTGSEEDVSIDKVLTEAIENYTSIMQNATNDAQNLAQEWLKWWFNDDNSLTTKAEMFLELLNGIASVLLALGGVAVIGAIKKLSVVLGFTGSSMTLIVAGFGALIWGIAKFISAFDQLSDRAKIWIPVVWGLVGALTALVVATRILKGNWVAAISAGALIAGLGMAVSTQARIPNYETGASDIDSGTVFRAGEFGKTEAVYTGSNGKTNVANVKQMEQAFYNALSRYGAEDGGKIVVEAYLDGEKVYQNTTAKAKARGKVWANA